MKLINTQANQALLVDAISEVYGISIEALNTKMRFREVVNARQMMFKVARDHFGMTYKEIGRVLLPNRHRFDHSTILYAKRTVDGYLKVGDENTTAKYNAVMSYIGQKIKRDSIVTIHLKESQVGMVLDFLNEHKLEFNINTKI